MKGYDAIDVLAILARWPARKPEEKDDDPAPVLSVVLDHIEEASKTGVMGVHRDAPPPATRVRVDIQR